MAETNPALLNVCLSVLRIAVGIILLTGPMTVNVHKKE